MIRKRGKGMHIAGLQKLSLLDYPGKVACTVFLSGCNLRCPYCHNAELISPHYAGEKISQTELMNFLDSRKEKIDGVCISGGEPTLTPELLELIKAIRKKGFFVKIDTNGTNPEMLKKLIEEKLVDYVAMDIKNSRIHYSEACGTEILPQIEESVHHLMNGNIDYEFRTNLSYTEVKHCIESFIFGVNTPSRWGTQAPFTNITLDWTVPPDLAVQPCIVGGKQMDFTYGDCKKEMDMINKAFIEVMIEGDAEGRGFQYPIPTYSITRDFDWSETKNNRLLFEMTAKYGTPYFSNYINSDMEPSDVRSMCCRLRLDLRELRKKSGGFFGSGESTGSIGVVTINMPQIAYLSSDENEFFKRLDKLMEIAARSLKIKRTTVEKLMDAGLYPYTKRYLGSFDNHFSTIGLVGMNEAGLNAKWLNMGLTYTETQDFAVRVLNHMRKKLSDYQEQYGDLYNLEATPAESTAYRLAKHNKTHYPDIITANENGTPYYTNSSHLPVGYTEDVFSALDIQDKLQPLYTSGTVFHTFLGEKLPDWKSAAALVRKIAENYELLYYTLSPTYSVCANHGYLAGEQSVCPKCGNKTEVYSRITGYYRPVQNWNDGKSQEFLDRKTYSVNMKNVSEKHNEEAEPFSQALHFELYTTSTCPNCRLIKPVLENAGIEFEVRDAEVYEADAKKLGLTQAPSLVAYGDEIVIYSGIGKIKEFIDSRNKASQLELLTNPDSGCASCRF